MAQWQILDSKGAGHSWEENGETVHTFDDGLAYEPGEEGFDRTAADAKAAGFGKGFTAAYMGTPNWHLRVEQEAKDAAEAREAERLRLAEEEAEGALDRELDAAREAGRQSAETARRQALIEAAFAEGAAERNRA